MDTLEARLDEISRRLGQQALTPAHAPAPAPTPAPAPAPTPIPALVPAPPLVSNEESVPRSSIIWRIAKWLLCVVLAFGMFMIIRRFLARQAAPTPKPTRQTTPHVSSGEVPPNVRSVEGLLRAREAHRAAVNNVPVDLATPLKPTDHTQVRATSKTPVKNVHIEEILPQDNDEKKEERHPNPATQKPTKNAPVEEEEEEEEEDEEEEEEEEEVRPATPPPPTRKRIKRKHDFKISPPRT